LNKRYPHIHPVKSKIPKIPYEIIAIYPKSIKLSRAAAHFLKEI